MMNEHLVGTAFSILASGTLVAFWYWVRRSTEGCTRRQLVALLEREGFLHPIFVHVEETERYCALAEARAGSVCVRLNISPHPDGESVRIIVTDFRGFNGSEKIVRP